jgi:cysteinyl-tRNA synthetase
MEEDFNGARAASYLHDLVSKSYGTIIPSGKAELALRALRAFKRIDQVLGVLEEAFQTKGFDKEFVDRLVKIIIDVRQLHRERKEYEIADRIRDQLAALGIKVMDSKTGSTWVYL